MLTPQYTKFEELEHNLTLTKEKNILVIVKYNLKINGGALDLRLTFGHLPNVDSFTRNKGTEYASGTFYVIKKLPAGTHLITLERKFEMKPVQNPKGSPVNEHVNMQILEFE